MEENNQKKRGKKARLILGSVLLAIVLIIIVSIANSIRASAFTGEQPLVQLFIGSPENTVSSGTVTNQRFGVAVSEPGFISIQYPDGESEMRYVNESLLFNYSQIGTYVIYRFRLERDTLIFYDFDIQVTFDNTAPSISLFSGTQLVPNSSFVKENISANAAANIADIRAFEVSIAGASFIPYTNQIFTSDAAYVFRAVDNAGNEAHAMITKDTGLPIVKIYAEDTPLENNALTNAARIEVYATDELSGIEELHIRLPEESFFTRFFQSTITITKSGRYEAFAVDRSGNVSETVIVTLDNIPPIIFVTHEGEELFNHAFINGNLITFHVDKSTATGFVHRFSTNETSVILDSATITEEDKYLFYATDTAGNKSREITVIIDRTPKSVTLGNITGSTATDDVSLNWEYAANSAPIILVTVNGVYVENSSVIKTINNGRYEVVSLDEAGNIWTFVFAAIRTDIETVTTNQFWWEAKDENQQVYAFESFENAVSFSELRERNFVTIHTWNSGTWDTGFVMDSQDAVNAQHGEFFVYKRFDNPNIQAAYFTLERLNQVIRSYAEKDLSKFYFWDKVPAQSYTGNDLFKPFTNGSLIVKSLSLRDGLIYKINGVLLSGTSYSVAGRHTLTVLDEFENSYHYTLIIVGTAPDLEFRYGNGDYYFANVGQAYYLTNAITVKLLDAYDEFALAQIRNADGEILHIIGVGVEITLLEAGKYVIEAINHFGKAEFVFYISYSSPQIKALNNVTDNQLEVTVTPSTDKEIDLITLAVYHSVNNTDWVLLQTDDEENEVNISTLEYIFNSTGFYKIRVEDKCRNGFNAVVLESYFENTMLQINPLTADLEGVVNGGRTSGVVRLVNPSQEVIITAYRNAEEFTYRLGDILSETGLYQIILTDEAGNTAEFNFEIYYTVNAAGVIFIVILIFAITAAVAFFLFKKKIIKFGSKKKKIKQEKQSASPKETDAE